MNITDSPSARQKTGELRARTTMTQSVDRQQLVEQAQMLCREHGGSLSYRSRRGHTVFTLLLPAARDS